jgi:hypothetical protein
MYLRCLAGDWPRQWLQWLPWAEYCYNTSFHSSLRSTPFKVVYGREPPSLRAYTPSEAHLSAIHQQLMECDEFICQVREWLEQAQNHYKLQYDGGHWDLEFQPRDWVWLCLLHALSLPSTSRAGANWVLSSTALFKYANASAIHAATTSRRQATRHLSCRPAQEVPRCHTLWPWSTTISSPWLRLPRDRGNDQKQSGAESP